MKNILILFNYNLFLSIKIFSKMSKYQNTIIGKQKYYYNRILHILILL